MLHLLSRFLGRTNHVLQSVKHNAPMSHKQWQNPYRTSRYERLVILPSLPPPRNYWIHRVEGRKGRRKTDGVDDVMCRHTESKIGFTCTRFYYYTLRDQYALVNLMYLLRLDDNSLPSLDRELDQCLIRDPISRSSALALVEVQLSGFCIILPKEGRGGDKNSMLCIGSIAYCVCRNAIGVLYLLRHVDGSRLCSVCISSGSLLLVHHFVVNGTWGRTTIPHTLDKKNRYV